MLELITVCGIIVACSLMALAKIIEGTAVVAIFSSTAGYVLGSIGRTKLNRQDDTITTGE